jgi:F-type H+-transporting ATPase subunit delta
MSNPAVAKRYAEALFDVANSQGQVDTVEQELAGVVDVLNQHPALNALLQAPSLSVEVKKQQVTELFGTRVSATVLNFLKLLFDRRRQEDIKGIYNEFVRLVDQARNRVKATVESATVLTEEELQTLTEKLGTGGKQVKITTKVNPALIGGLRVRVGDRVFDYSVKTRLERFRATLKY